MLQWLIDIVDLYGNHPAYLRVNGRPVIFIYAAAELDPSTWTDLMSRLNDTGRNPLLIGDFYQSRLIEPLDGEYQYSNVGLSAIDLFDRYRIESSRVRTYNLLRPGDRRRIWVASVTPGSDDTRLVARPVHTLIDRNGGQLYDDQWLAALNMAADWVVVTSWNEWWENTEIEPSERYGTYYLDRTRAWIGVFKGPATNSGWVSAPQIKMINEMNQDRTPRVKTTFQIGWEAGIRTPIPWSRGDADDVGGFGLSRFY